MAKRQRVGPFDRIEPDEWETAREAIADSASQPQPQSLVDIDMENPRVRVLEAEWRSGRAVGRRTGWKG